MFDELRRAIEGLEVPAEGAAIAEVRHLVGVLESRLAEAEAAHVRSGRFEVEGFRSPGAFLRRRCRLAPGDARRVASRARRLAAWPGYLAAWQAGALSPAQVDATVALVPERHGERFATVASAVAEIVAPLTLEDTRRVLGHWVERADALADREAAEAGTERPVPPPERELFVSRTTGGVAVVRGELDPDSAVVVEQALAAAARPDVDGEHRTPARRRADALVEVCRSYDAHHPSRAGTRRPERLTVTCDVTALYRSALRGAGVRTAEQLGQFLAERPTLGALERGLFLDAFDGRGGVARTLDGNPIGDGLLSAVSTGGVLERLLTAEGRVLDHGRAVRSHSPAQWRALAVRDGGCRLPGCDDPPERCVVHHVERWESGGRTDVDHAVLLSPRCHTLVHRPGWSDRVEPDGTYVVRSGDGTVHTSVPPGRDGPEVPPVPSSAEPARPLPFDPVVVRRPGSAPPSPADDLHDRLHALLAAHAHLGTDVLDALPRRRDLLTGPAARWEGLPG